MPPVYGREFGFLTFSANGRLIEPVFQMELSPFPPANPKAAAAHKNSALLKLLQGFIVWAEDRI